MLQLPLYTVWTTGTRKQQVFAVVHCTVGDAMIAGHSLLVARPLLARTPWPSGSASPSMFLRSPIGRHWRNDEYEAIDVANFTPVSAAIGGALIGLAATLLMLFTGCGAGISGILGGCLDFVAADRSWRAAFIVGLVLAPLVGGFVGYPIPSP
jgi:hypothetical protein